MPEPMVFLNGEMVPRSRAQVSVRDVSFRHGEGIFEDFEDRFLRKNFMARLSFSLLRPLEFMRIAFTPYTIVSRRQAPDQSRAPRLNSKPSS